MEGKWPQTWAGMRTQGSRGFSEFVIPLKGFGAGTGGKEQSSALGTYFCGGQRMGQGQGTQRGRAWLLGGGHRRSKSR